MQHPLLESSAAVNAPSHAKQHRLEPGAAALALDEGTDRGPLMPGELGRCPRNDHAPLDRGPALTRRDHRGAEIVA